MKNNIKLICFDLNETLIKENTWISLNRAMGMTDAEDQRLYELYKAGKLDYVDWQKELEIIYKKSGKATKKNILKTVSKYTYMKGAKNAVSYFKKQGYQICIITGSIDLLAEMVSKELGIEIYNSNNVFVFDKNDYLKEIKCIGDANQTKPFQLKEICKDLAINVADTVCIGDGSNDIELFRITKHGITFSNSKIKDCAWKVIDNLNDLKKIF